MRLLWVMLAGLSIGIFAPGATAEDAKPPEAKDQPTLMCERGKSLLSEDFSGSTLPAEWKVAKGKWAVAEDVLKGTEVATDMHAAVVRRDLKAHDLVAQFSFKLDGGKSTAFSLNNAKGHVCRVTINANGFAIAKD